GVRSGAAGRVFGSRFAARDLEGEARRQGVRRAARKRLQGSAREARIEAAARHMPRREAIRAAALMPSGDPALARSVGALVGLAVGDALGAPVEGLPRDSYPPIVELGSGEGTDDTGMAICLAESLLERGFLDQADLLRRFVLWYRAGGRGLSTTTRAVLEAFESTERLDVAHGAANAGNGCIMRLAPVAIRYRGDRRAAREAAEAQARVTHGAEEAIAASACLADILVAGLATGDFE